MGDSDDTGGAKKKKPRKKSGPKPGMTHAAKVRRDTEIVRLADQGITYQALSRQYDLRADHICNIVKAARADRRKILDESEMVDHVNATLAMYDQMVEDVALRLRDMKPEHHASFVGAMRLKLETIARRWDLLQAIGYVPQSLATVRVQMEALDVANDLVKVLEAFEGERVDDRLFDAVIAVLEGREAVLPVRAELPESVEGTAVEA